MREPLFDGFRGGLERTFFHGHSYSGNQLGCAAALANLDLFEEEQTLSKVARGAAILKEASQAFWELPQTGDVRQEGMVLAVELVRDRATREPFPSQDRLAHRINERARAKGLLARGLGATLFLIPPYCSTEEELRRMVAALLASAREVLN
ncbi:MAG: aminotransferase class III-fold pyridoxal phosphate-dependent enzyme [Verrucomicrobium sp.]|nr:aminotransferase class III-fold pyridoxal phosphate-dependent enzyme [Verrucomicrobium sp.]